MQHERTPSPDPDGVRITRERAPLPKAALLAFAGLGFGLLLMLLPRPAPAPATVDDAGTVAAAPTPANAASVDVTPDPATSATQPASATPMQLAPAVKAAPAPAEAPRTAEDNDIASRFRPGDEAPTAAELIQALRDAGETGGIAAFNPPGTSPPMSGLVVPPDFPLPPGYVRHHQWTDEGEPVEAILMFAPDFVLRDAEGREVPLPENRVVPPELAPPGLPIRPVEVPGE